MKCGTEESNLVTLPFILEQAILEVMPSYRLILSFSRRSLIPQYLIILSDFSPSTQIRQVHFKIINMWFL